MPETGFVGFRRFEFVFKKPSGLRRWTRLICAPADFLSCYETSTGYISSLAQAHSRMCPLLLPECALFIFYGQCPFILG